MARTRARGERQAGAVGAGDKVVPVALQPVVQGLPRGFGVVPEIGNGRVSRLDVCVLSDGRLRGVSGGIHHNGVGSPLPRAVRPAAPREPSWR